MDAPGTGVPCLMKAWAAHEAELRAWLRRRWGDSTDIDDLLQDVFIKALHQGSRFCGIGHPRAWLFEVARNTLTDRARKRRDLIELPGELAVPVAENPAVDDLAACLPLALAELTEVDREAIRLCDLEGLTQHDYARRKGLSLPGAKSRVQRARQRLRDQLFRQCRVRLDDLGRVCCFTPRTEGVGRSDSS